ncbi:hypothetical protein [Geomonas sp.]|uniref:hypothetical protein n=1 Tax=Geomonas sp. TaxID=2651584 RepID=UPI002B48A645|nr:hypothetical protein [Geomonas sp.]HJV33780.1 hypothetical protein [Geomonas sp.]
MKTGSRWIALVVLGASSLAWGAEKPATTVLPKVAVKPSPPGTQKTAYQRRQEAKKHLQEALALREAVRSGQATAPATSGGAK